MVVASAVLPIDGRPAKNKKVGVLEPAELAVHIDQSAGCAGQTVIGKAFSACSIATITESRSAAKPP